MTGRPRFEPTDARRELVSALAACGVRQEIIASRIGIDPKTLRRSFRRELKEGKQDACAVVAESLFRMATGTGRGAVAAAIFWLKTQAGWREVQVVQSQQLDKHGNATDQLRNEAREIAQAMTPEQITEQYRRMLNG